MTSAFVHGFLLAAALILPLGPQNMFVIGQGATHRQYRRALPVVLTAAVSDTLLIGIAVLGVSLVVLELPVLKAALTVFGIMFLVWMGWHSWRAPVDKLRSDDAAMAYWTLRRRIMYTLRVSLLNPHAVMDTVVLIGGGAALYSTPANKLAYALAAVLVSWIWFFAISVGGRALRHLPNQALMQRWVNRISAGIMWATAGRYLIQLCQVVWNTQT